MRTTKRRVVNRIVLTLDFLRRHAEHALSISVRLARLPACLVGGGEAPLVEASSERRAASSGRPAADIQLVGVSGQGRMDNGMYVSAGESGVVVMQSKRTAWWSCSEGQRRRGHVVGEVNRTGQAGDVQFSSVDAMFGRLCTSHTSLGSRLAARRGSAFLSHSPQGEKRRDNVLMRPIR